jgi:hypothetical protein
MEMKLSSQLHSDSHPLLRYTKPIQAGLQLLESNNRSIDSSAGFDRSLFVADPENCPEDLLASFVCVICMDICREGKVTDCGHSYCSGCLTKSLALRLECPQDRLNLSSSFLHKTSIYDIDLRAEIEKLTVKCMNCSAGCCWEGRLSALFDHLKQQCQWQECQFARFGCTFKVERNMEKSSEKSHHNDNNNNSDSSADVDREHGHLQLVYEQLNSVTGNNAKLSETLTDSFRTSLFPLMQRQEALLSHVNYFYQQQQNLMQEVKQRDAVIEHLVEQEKLREERQEQQELAINQTYDAISGYAEIKRWENKLRLAMGVGAVFVVGTMILTTIFGKLRNQGSSGSNTGSNSISNNPATNAVARFK